MTLDKEKLKERLNKMIDVALQVGKVRQEVWNERNLEKDDNLHWAEVDFARNALLFESGSVVDEIWKQEREKKD